MYYQILACRGLKLCLHTQLDQGSNLGNVKPKVGMWGPTETKKNDRRLSRCGEFVLTKIVKITLNAYSSVKIVVSGILCI